MTAGSVEAVRRARARARWGPYWAGTEQVRTEVAVVVDGDWVERARAGDADAFALLVEQSRDRLWSVCLRITGDHGDAEDALQDALTAAWQNIGSFRATATFSTWCYRIAANAAIAVCRRRRGVTVGLSEVSEMDQWFGIADATSQVDDRDLVTSALARVAPGFREALVLREYGDLTYEQIAMHQGVPVQTVKSRINRARRQLADAVRSAGV